MKHMIFVLLFVIAGCFASGAQQSTQNVAPPPAKSTSKVTPPKAIVTPSPDPVADRVDRPTVLWLVIGTDGLPRDVKVVRSSGSSQADANASAAVQKWRFNRQ